MKENSEIQFLYNNEIDKQQWDECITSSPNGLIYGRTFYLDNVCPQWCALIGNNYEWVFPVTYNRKWGISYLYQPPFSQQLGVFAKSGINPPLENIINWLKKNFKFWDINWNYATKTGSLIPPIEIAEAVNFVLDLSKGYESIAAGYHHDLIKNIKKSKRLRLSYLSIQDYNNCIEAFKKNYKTRLANVKERDYQNFGTVCKLAAEQNMFIGRKIVNDKEELMAVILLFFYKNRLYNIMNTTTEAGRKTSANHFLLDAVIEEFSEKNLLFDFEGSDLPGVKSFYENFGAINQPYYKLKYNALPPIVRLFKK